MKIALLGYGIETESAYKYYKKLYPSAEFVSYDDKPEPKNTLPKDVKFVGNYHDFHNIDADIVVRTPAIAPSRISSRGAITSATKEFFTKCSAPIIGVTGTKGKGTTCSLIAEILKAAGKKVWLVGNIGAPALDVLDKIKPGDIVVYELSSFQLWDLEVSPHTAVVLMIESDHLNVHKNFEDYLKAKMNITRHQHENDIVVYHPINPHSQTIAEISPAQIKRKYLSQEGAYIIDETVVINEQLICSISDVGLVGEFNLENVCAAITAAWEYTQNVEAITKAVKNFKGLEHRLEYVRTLNGVEFYNSSMSTTPGSALATMKSFRKPEILIMGGFDRKTDFTSLAYEVKMLPNIKKILLIGETKKAIAKAFDEAGFDNYKVGFDEEKYDDIVKKAYSLATANDVILLNPACPSFDAFENFSERGKQFKQLVMELK